MADGETNMYHRTKPSGIIQFTTTYNGRKIKFGFDRDIVFINCVCYEDGSDVPCEDVIRCIYEIHRSFPNVAMVDGTGSYVLDQETKALKKDGNGPVYGNGIVFDTEGRPIVKIVDDVVLSSHIKCKCEDYYPPAAYIITEPLSKSRKQVKESGCFTDLKRRVPFGKFYCNCKKCGAEYCLSGHFFPKWTRITPYEWPED